MKIAVYTIAKNEEKFVHTWVNSAKAADYLVVLDTGSTDNTVKCLQDYRYPNIIVDVQRFDPFRFDQAREAALALVPDDADICISLDMDELLAPNNWREIIEKQYQAGVNRIGYNYIWNFDENNNPITQFITDKIHGRHTHYWKNMVHEVVTPKDGVEEKSQVMYDLIIEHHADNTKPRTELYLNLLIKDTQADPTNDRNCHYLGREYFFNARYDEAITELKRHLNLPSAVWDAERCASMRFIAKCYMALGNEAEALRWMLRAMAEDDHSKEAKLELAVYYTNKQDYELGLLYCLQTIRTIDKFSSYIHEKYFQEEGAFEYAGICYYYLQNYTKAIEMFVWALKFNPTEPRLISNLDWATKAEKGDVIR